MCTRGRAKRDGVGWERSRGVAGSALPRVTGRKTFRLERIEGNLIEPEPMAASPTTCDVGKGDRTLPETSGWPKARWRGDRGYRKSYDLRRVQVLFERYPRA